MRNYLFLFVLLMICACDNRMDWIDAPTDPPVVYSITPDSGTAGTEVKITGEHFSATIANVSVSINGTAATITDASSSMITFIAPNGTTGPVVVTVNSLPAENQPVFTYK